MSGGGSKRGRGRPRLSPDGLMVARSVGMTPSDWAIVERERLRAETSESVSAALRRIVRAWEIAVVRRAELVREMADLDAMGVTIAVVEEKTSGPF